MFSLRNSYIEMLKSDSAIERRQAAYILHEYDSLPVRKALLQSLTDPDPMVKVEVINSLVWLREKNAKTEIKSLLNDPSSMVRNAASTAIGALGDDSDADSLLSLVRDPDEKVAISAVIALGMIGDSYKIVESLSSLLESTHSVEIIKAVLTTISKRGNLQYVLAFTKAEEPTVRSLAFSLLDPTSSKDAFQALLVGVSDSSGDVRYAALSSLSKIKNDQVLLRLLRAASDESPLVRRRVAELLSDFPLDEVASKLSHLLSDVDPGVRRTTALSLGKLKDEQAVAQLAEAIKVETVLSTKCDMVNALSRIGSKNVVNVLESLCHAPEPGVRIIALRGLVAYGYEDIGRLAVEIANNDPDDWARGQAAAVIASVYHEGSIDILRGVISSGQWTAKVAVAEAIKDLLTDDGLELLKDLSKEAHPQVRSTAYDTMGYFRSPSAEKYLLVGLRDNDADVKWSVINSLGKIGSARIISHLRNAAEDDTNTYRGKISEAAKNAIALIKSRG